MNIKERLPTFRSAVLAMIEGLTNPAKYGLTVRMTSFGTCEEGTCFGCAATATLLACGERAPSDYEEELYLSHFEGAIDDFRNGLPGPLLRYYGHGKIASPYWRLTTDNLSALGIIKTWLDDNFPEEEDETRTKA